jgi:hypothetical protein
MLSSSLILVFLIWPFLLYAATLLKNCISAVSIFFCVVHSTNGGEGNAHRILEGKPEGKRPLGRPRHRWEDNIKMDLREIGWGGMDWIDLAQDRD